MKYLNEKGLRKSILITLLILSIVLIFIIESIRLGLYIGLYPGITFTVQIILLFIYSAINNKKSNFMKFIKGVISIATIISLLVLLITIIIVGLRFLVFDRTATIICAILMLVAYILSRN